MNNTAKNTYLFVTETDYSSGHLTGAHKRLIELAKGIAKEANVIMVSKEIPQLSNVENINFYYINKRKRKLPHHINGMLDICNVLMKIKHTVSYDYAISFGPSNTICYGLCGYKNIISLFREDLIGYLTAVKTDKLSMYYYRFQEIAAVKLSSKIIVQCNNDRKNLISRNRKFDTNIEKKTYIQINNVNVSWMEAVNHKVLDKKRDNIEILFVGDFSNSRKGHDILLVSIKRLLDEGSNIKLYVAGDGEQLDYYKNKYRDYNNIVFLGRVNVLKYLKSCDFEIVPSLIDSCPNTVLEGLNAGIAVYGSNAGGIPDILMDQRFLFEPNRTDLYNFLFKIINNKRYIEDAYIQKTIKDKLSFDWAHQIVSIINKQ